MVELNIDDKVSPIGYAGDTLNTAIYLRRALNRYHKVSFVSVIGTDPLSDRMATFIADQRINIDNLKRHSDKLPGIYSISKSSEGERSFHYWRENSAARTLFEDGFDFLREYNVIFLSGITLAILPSHIRNKLLEWLEHWDGLFAFDSNYRPKLWETKGTARLYIERAWEICDLALPSLDDEMELFEDKTEADVIRRFNRYDARLGALKRGGMGPFPLFVSEDLSTKFPAAEWVVDTTAAGDSFNGTFLADILEGRKLGEALLHAHQVASRVIGFEGAIAPEG